MSAFDPKRTSAAIFCCGALSGPWSLRARSTACEIQHQAGNRQIEAAVRDRQGPRVTNLEQSGGGGNCWSHGPPALTIVRLAATYRRNALRSAIGGRTYMMAAAIIAFHSASTSA